MASVFVCASKHVHLYPCKDSALDEPLCKSAVEKQLHGVSPRAFFVGGKILAGSVLCTRLQCCFGVQCRPRRELEQPLSAALLDESLPYSLKANCGTRRSAEYSCAGIWEQGRDGRSALLALCHVKISPYIIWLPRASLHLL